MYFIREHHYKQNLSSLLFPLHNIAHHIPYAAVIHMARPFRYIIFESWRREGKREREREKGRREQVKLTSDETR